MYVEAELYAKYADELLRVGPSAAEDVVSEAVTRAFGSSGWRSVEH